MSAARWLLVNPPTGRYIREDRCQAPVRGLIATSLRPPLDLAYVAAAVSAAGVDCRLVDYPAEQKSWDHFVHDVRRYRPTHLVINTTMFTLEQDMEAGRLAKLEVPDVITLAKGAAFACGTLVERYPHLDAAVTGDYELGFAGIAAGTQWTSVPGLVYRRDEVVRLNSPLPAADLDQLPEPRSDLITHRLYPRPDTGRPQATVLVGRGCAGACIYCIAPIVNGRRVRYRSPDRVVQEMALYLSRYRVADFYLQADTFTWDRDWLEDFCRLLITERLPVSWVCNSRVDRIDRETAQLMKRAGCWGLSLGIETGNEQILSLIKKGTTLEQARQAVADCRDQGLVTLLHFMIGFPWDDDSTIRDTVRFARSLRGSLCEFNLVTPLPGTPLWDLAADSGLLAAEPTLAGADYSTAVARTLHLDRDRLLRWRRRAIASLYMDPGFVWRSLRHMNSPRRLWRCTAMLVGKLASALAAGGKRR